MITKMKKLTFLVYHKEYEEFLNSLRELGVVHIVEKQQGAADNTELQENIRLSNRLTATLKLLQNQKHEKDADRNGRRDSCSWFAGIGRSRYLAD